MYIHLSQPYAPAGPVSFLITNASTTMQHELVGFATPTMAADFPITGFEGDPNKINEDKAGTSVLDTGAALKPGASQMVTIPNMKPGHYALVCNLSGHYKAGMHVDFWVTPKGATPVTATLGDTSSTQMYIHLSQPYAPAGPVSFLITNASTTMQHELVGFATPTMAADFPITGFEGDPNKINEDKAGTSVLDTGAALKPGASQMVTIPNMKPGHYALVCNLSGHYKAGMHVDFWVTPKGATPVTATLGDTSSTQMYIHLSQPYAPAGPVSFLITNASTTMQHELVGFATPTMAADFPITGFEGDPNKINEDKAGTSVLDTGAALKPGASQMVTIPNMKPGHYALVCNLSGHYKAGMHVDFWVTPKGATPVTATLGDTSSTQMYIHLSQPYAPAGPVSFLITNASTTMQHELVGFATPTMAADFPITGFEGDPNKINEDKAGTSVLDTGAALKPGASQMVTIPNMKPGHYALVCNLSGHYKAGMHVDFWVTPTA